VHNAAGFVIKVPPFGRILNSTGIIPGRALTLRNPRPYRPVTIKEVLAQIGLHQNDLFPPQKESHVTAMPIFTPAANSC